MNLPFELSSDLDEHYMKLFYSLDIDPNSDYVFDEEYVMECKVVKKNKLGKNLTFIIVRYHKNTFAVMLSLQDYDKDKQLSSEEYKSLRASIRRNTKLRIRCSPYKSKGLPKENRNSVCLVAKEIEVINKFNSKISHISRDVGLTINNSSPYTEENRYRDIFEYIKLELFTNTDTVQNKVNRIMSFGCSYGLECLTLNDVFGSRVDGIDIDEDITSHNIQNNTNDLIEYYTDMSTIQSRMYDMVCCMSVLCHYQMNSDNVELKNKYKIERFQETLMNIDKHVKVNGYLVIYDGQYLLDDTELHDKYEFVMTYCDINNKICFIYRKS